MGEGSTRSDAVGVTNCSLTPLVPDTLPPTKTAALAVERLAVAAAGLTGMRLVAEALGLAIAAWTAIAVVAGAVPRLFRRPLLGFRGVALRSGWPVWSPVTGSVLRISRSTSRSLPRSVPSHSVIAKPERRCAPCGRCGARSSPDRPAARS